MEERTVAVRLCGEQRCGADTEKNELTARGILRQVPAGWRLSYEESSAESGKIQADLLAAEGRVTLVRRGAVRSKMVFAPGELHSAFYALGVGTLTMDIQTERMSVQLGTKGGWVELDYRILTEGAEVSQNRLHICVKPMEEV